MGLKKLLLLMLLGICITSSAQRPNRHFREYIDFSKYEVIDSLPLERMYIYSPFDYDDNTIINAGEGIYLIEMPQKDKIIIRKTKDNSKAIVVYNSIIFGRHKEFNIKDDRRRTILWYEDDNIYCGYIYDKFYKVCKYFESKL